MINLNEIKKITILNVYEGQLFDLLLNRYDYFIRYHKIGQILLVRNIGYRRGNYGVIGIWLVNSDMVRIYNPNILPLINFETPFNEELRGNISTKVRNLTKTPYLTKPYTNMFKSGRSYYIAIDYIKEILREKREECNLTNFTCPNIITDNDVDIFIERLIEHIDDNNNT